MNRYRTIRVHVAVRNHPHQLLQDALDQIQMNEKLNSVVPYHMDQHGTSSFIVVIEILS